jgi:hypothetical protein
LLSGRHDPRIPFPITITPKDKTKKQLYIFISVLQMKYVISQLSKSNQILQKAYIFPNAITGADYESV